MASNIAERVTVNLTERSARALQLAMNITQDSKTDTLNRAIQVYAYFAYLAKEGQQVFVRQPDGELQQIVTLI